VARERKSFSPEFRETAAREVVENSRSIASVAREIGVHDTTLGNWVRAYREKHQSDVAPLDLSERARLLLSVIRRGDGGAGQRRSV
jgi:transposase-like protein